MTGYILGARRRYWVAFICAAVYALAAFADTGVVL